MNAQTIAAKGHPVLLVDTCSILDVMRDPTREKPRLHEHQAGLDLLTAAETGTLVGVMAQQVVTEFADNDQQVQDVADRALEKLLGQIDHVNRLSGMLGAPGPLDLAHLDGHVARTRDIVHRWLRQLVPYQPTDGVVGKAYARMIGSIAPARRGKESMKDCIVFETYLEFASMLRTEGLAAPIVFLSSNTEEYSSDSRVTKIEIADDLARVGASYASNMAAAKHQLGL